jgi:hypothetical protein
VKKKENKRNNGDTLLFLCNGNGGTFFQLNLTQWSYFSVYQMNGQKFLIFDGSHSVRYTWSQPFCHMCIEFFFQSNKLYFHEQLCNNPIFTETE